MKKLLMLILAGCLVAPSYGQKRRTYKKKQNRTTQVRKATTTANAAVMGIGCGLETYRLNYGSYGGWLSFFLRFAPGAKEAETSSGQLIAIKKEIRRIDEGNVAAGKRFICELVKDYGLNTAINQLFDLWQFTSSEMDWLENTARYYEKQLKQKVTLEEDHSGDE